MMYPTPNARDYMSACTNPTKHENQYHLNDIAKRLDIYENLSNANLPGCKEQRKSFSNASQFAASQLCSKNIGGGMTDSVKSQSCYQLNPDWVEWLMGWCIGWTDITVDNNALCWMPIQDDPADTNPTSPSFIPRTTDRKQNRVQRIIALGNGQVPICAAVAFEFGFSIFDYESRNKQNAN